MTRKEIFKELRNKIREHAAKVYESGHEVSFGYQVIEDIENILKSIDENGLSSKYKEDYESWKDILNIIKCLNGVRPVMSSEDLLRPPAEEQEITAEELNYGWNGPKMDI